MDPADRDALTRWLAEARAAEDAAARTRVRRLVGQAAEEGTLLTACLDLAERAATARIETTAGRTIQGVIAGAGRDFVLVAGDGGRALVALSGVVAVRTTDPAARPPAEPRPPLGASLVDALAELMADRLSVGIVMNDGRGDLVTGVVVAVGADVITLRTDGEPPLTVYLRLESLVAVLLTSGLPATDVPPSG